MILLYRHQQHHNVTIIKQTNEDFFINICTSHFICNVCVWEGARDRTETSIFWSPLIWPATLCVSRSPDAPPQAQRPTLLGAGFLYCISSTTSLGPTQSGAPSPFGLVWLSLPHLVYNSSDLQLQPTWLLSWLSYVIVRAHSVSYSIFEIACLIVIKRK